MVSCCGLAMVHSCFYRYAMLKRNVLFRPTKGATKLQGTLNQVKTTVCGDTEHVTHLVGHKVPARTVALQMVQMAAGLAQSCIEYGILCRTQQLLATLHCQHAVDCSWGKCSPSQHELESSAH